MRLDSSRYEEIAMTASEVLTDYGINSFPIDVFELAKRMKFKVCTYSEFKPTETIVLLNGSDEGMSCYGCDSKRFLIVYNDSKIKTRIRFTIAHEIGHIVLGHKESNEETESEANFFARQLLVPPCVLLFKHITDFLVISNMFDVSTEVALNAINAIENRISFKHLTLANYEIDLLKHFHLYEEDKTWPLKQKNDVS